MRFRFIKVSGTVAGTARRVLRATVPDAFTDLTAPRRRIKRGPLPSHIPQWLDWAARAR